MTDHEARQWDAQQRDRQVRRLYLSFEEAMIYLDLDRVRTRELLDDHEIARTHIPLNHLEQLLRICSKYGSQP